MVVFERAATSGGLAASFTVGGQRVDHGSHRLHPATEPSILAAIHELLDGGLQWRPRHGRIRLEGRWIHFPLRAGDLARRLPPRFVARCAGDAVLAPVRRRGSDSYADVVRVGLGPTMLDHFYGPYARKMWGAEPEALSGEQARRRIAASSPAAMVAKVLGRGTGAAPPGFWYPVGGFGAIVDALEAAAREAGAEVRCGTEVVSVALGRHGARIGLASGDEVAADHVWSTLPMTALPRLVDAVRPPEVDAAADALPLRSLVLVYLVVDRPQWTEYDAHYLPGPETPVTRISEPKRYRDDPADPSGRTVLCAEIPCTLGDEVWSASTTRLAELVAEGIAVLGLPPVAPIEVEVKRVAAAYPIYLQGYEAAFAQLDRWADSLPGLVTLGRGGLHAHDNTHHAMAMGWAAADALGADGTWDAASWSEARRRFASHVVED